MESRQKSRTNPGTPTGLNACQSISHGPGQMGNNFAGQEFRPFLELTHLLFKECRCHPIVATS